MARQAFFLPVLALLFLVPLWSFSATGDCPAGTPVASLKLEISPWFDDAALPLSAINRVSARSKLHYEPVNIPKELEKTARVSVILVPVEPSGKKRFEVLPARPVNEATEWPIPERVSAIGIIFGPDGIDTKKVADLVEKHPEIVTKIADYAEQSTRVEGLISALTDYEKSPPNGRNLQSVLDRYSSEYGVKMPAVDASSSSSQQTLQMLNAVAPAVSANDPIALHNDVASKTGSLAGSVAVSYFGMPVALGIGGASLVAALHASLFPATNFRSAFGSPTTSGAMNLCSAKPIDSKAKSRINYLWISRIPDEEAPQVTLKDNMHVPAGSAAPITVSASSPAELERLLRAQDWQLISTADSKAIPVKVEKGTAPGSLTIDLSKAKVPAGQYELAAKWDWTPFQLKGVINVHDLGNLAKASLTPESKDALIAGTGPVKLQLTGTDFEFVQSAALIPEADASKKLTLPLTLPKGERQGEQLAMATRVDTSALAPGHYSLLIGQENGATGSVPITVHPSDPQLTSLPLRANLGEPQQTLVLHGTHLERIEKIAGTDAEWTLAPLSDGSADVNERQVTIKLAPTAKRGEMLNVDVHIQDIETPLQIHTVVQIAGPRPRITAVTKSFASQPDVELHEGEIPAGAAMSFALQADHIDSHPVLIIGCNNDSDTRQKVTVTPGDKNGSTELDLTGTASLFLALDPGIVGDSGCQMMASISERDTGISDAFDLGRVIRLPRISKFDISDQKAGDSNYPAMLTGEDLQLIDKTGWSESDGLQVQSIPTAIPGSPLQQNLKIEVPWPPPSPKAPLFIWLRGESRPRQSTARY